MNSRGRCRATAVFVTLTLAACALHVEPPRFTVQRIDWSGATPQGLAGTVTLAGYNPNGFELPLHDLDATVTLAGAPAHSTVSHLNVALPPQREIPVRVALWIPWSEVPAGVMAAATQSNIGYQVEGVVTVEHYLSVRSRFSQRGSIPREVLLQSGAAFIRDAASGLLH